MLHTKAVGREKWSRGRNGLGLAAAKAEQLGCDDLSGDDLRRKSACQSFTSLQRPADAS